MISFACVVTHLSLPGLKCKWELSLKKKTDIDKLFIYNNIRYLSMIYLYKKNHNYMSDIFSWFMNSTAKAVWLQDSFL